MGKWNKIKPEWNIGYSRGLPPLSLPGTRRTLCEIFIIIRYGFLYAFPCEYNKLSAMTPKKTHAKPYSQFIKISCTIMPGRVYSQAVFVRDSFWFTFFFFLIIYIPGNPTIFFVFFFSHISYTSVISRSRKCKSILHVWVRFPRVVRVDINFHSPDECETLSNFDL